GAIGYASTENRMSTINENQHDLLKKITTQALRHGLKSVDGEGAFAVVSDVNTGEVLSAVRVTRRGKQLEVDSNSLFLNVTNSPWSTAKPFVVAQAIENAVVKPGTLMDCENGVYVA